MTVKNELLANLELVRPAVVEPPREGPDDSYLEDRLRQIDRRLQRTHGVFWASEMERAYGIDWRGDLEWAYRQIIALRSQLAASRPPSTDGPQP